MARRKKQPQSEHRKKITAAAEQLFMEKGIENTTMSDIARMSGYSKATMYVYFKDKEELIGVLVLESMQKLYDYIKSALECSNDTKQRYLEICKALVRYQEEYPLYFKMVLDTINIDFETTRFLPEEKETFLVGEKINELLAVFLKEGMEKGDVRADLQIHQAIFFFWGTLSGLILLSTNKANYIGQEMKLSREDFLQQGFGMLYRTIVGENA